jgi:transposase
MTSISNDLKQCIYRWRTEDRLTIQQCADRAGCSVGLVAKVLKNMDEFGTVNNPFKKRTGRPREADGMDITYIKYIY